MYIYNSLSKLDVMSISFMKSKKKEQRYTHISLKTLNWFQLKNLRDVPLDVSYSQEDPFVHITTHVSNDRNVTS